MHAYKSAPPHTRPMRLHRPDNALPQGGEGFAASQQPAIGGGAQRTLRAAQRGRPQFLSAGCIEREKLHALLAAGVITPHIEATVAGYRSGHAGQWRTPAGCDDGPSRGGRGTARQQTKDCQRALPGESFLQKGARRLESPSQVAQGRLHLLKKNTPYGSEHQKRRSRAVGV